MANDWWAEQEMFGAVTDETGDAMTTDEYVPSEGQIRAACYDVFRPAEFDRFLARVKRDAKAEALREAAENVDVGSLVDSWTRGAVTRLSATNAVAEVLMSLRSRAAEYETGDSDDHR